jgi:TetR/AcrR family transcriptional repressor of lmrAB and yxaGH operons
MMIVIVKPERPMPGSRKSTKGKGSTPAKPEGQERTPRERMVLAAVSLLSERGLAGASFSEVIERSGAPRGSIYHHFPGGKDSLAAEAIALVCNHLVALLRKRDGATPTEVVRRFVDAWRGVLTRSDCQAGCAVAAVANEQPEESKLRAQAAAVFVSWERELEESLHAAGMPRAKARSAASLILAAVEGALILCRARREIAPLDSVEAALIAFVDGR